MTHNKILVTLILMIFANLVTASQTPNTNQKQKLDIPLIQQLTGLKGQLDDKTGAYKVILPRNDLSVNVSGIPLFPTMGLTSWYIFQPTEKGVRLSMDLVLQENQVNPIMSVALENNFKVTALNNLYLWDNPRIMVMHIEATGDEQSLGTGLSKMFVKLRENQNAQHIKNSKNNPKINVYRSVLNTKKIDEILGVPGQIENRTYRVLMSESNQKIRSQYDFTDSNHGGAWATFLGTDDEALINGNFIIGEDKLQEVLKALREAGINIVSIHPFFMNGKAKLISVHYWGTGNIQELAQGLRDALDKLQSKTS